MNVKRMAVAGMPQSIGLSGEKEVGGVKKIEDRSSADRFARGEVLYSYLERVKTPEPIELL
jgi:hypothetical protein